MYVCLTSSYPHAGFVNLTVDGRGSLSGAYCPGTVKLFCEGTDLTSVRWSFNGGTVIESFLPVDTETITFPSAQYPAFVSVELTHVVQNTNPVFGNFSSILTVDLSQLEEQSVSSISCGDPGTSKTVLVNVVIIRRSRPDSPNITGVTATYNSNGVRSVTVAWNKVVSLIIYCTISACTKLCIACMHNYMKLRYKYC